MIEENKTYELTGKELFAIIGAVALEWNEKLKELANAVKEKQ